MRGFEMGSVPFDSRTGFVMSWPARPPLPTGNTWEERMAQRAAARRLVAEAERACEVEALLAEAKARAAQASGALAPVDWLNGWAAMGEHDVLVGTGVHCLYCGAFRGTACVAFPADWVAPGPEPDWPLDPERCPICALRTLRNELC